MLCRLLGSQEMRRKMRKFKVSFEVETNDNGFVSSITSEDYLVAQKTGGRYEVRTVAIVPLNATIEEIEPPLKDGYYHGGGTLYRRRAGEWSYRGYAEWTRALGRPSDDQHRDDYFVAPLRARECDD